MLHQECFTSTFLFPPHPTQTPRLHLACVPAPHPSLPAFLYSFCISHIATELLSPPPYHHMVHFWTPLPFLNMGRLWFRRGQRKLTKDT